MNIYVAIPEGENRSTFLNDENVAFLETLGRLTWNDTGDHLSADQLAHALRDVDVLVCGWGTPCLDESVLRYANRLKLVAYVCGSVANVVSDAMYDRGIRILSGNEIFAVSVAEGTIAYMLTALRYIPFYVNHMRAEGWRPNENYSRGLLGKTVGIVGYGAISRHLLGLLRPFGVKIKLYSGHMTQEEAAALGVEKASLEEIFSTCDVVSLHCARNAKNYHLVDSRLLSMLRDGAVLVNTARGDVIDEEALAKEAATGRIRVVLDVYEEEPLSMSSSLRGMDNVILMPHKGGPTQDLRPDAARIVLEDVARFQRGEPMQNEISPSRAKMMTH